MKKLILVLLFVLTILLPGCSNEDTVEVPDEQLEDNFPIVERNNKNKRVYFVSRADHESGEIYLLENDGSIVRLTNNERHENNVALSPDGTKLAFHGGLEADPLTFEIYILNLNTMEEKQITNNKVIDGHPDWSPDSKKIIFASFIDENGNPSPTADLYTLDIISGKTVQLTNSLEEDNDPEWSPDGTKIVYKSTSNTKKSGLEEIYVMNADGSNKKRLTSVEGWQSDHDPSWSSDSKHIVFERFEGQRVWYDIGNADVLLDYLHELTPWNNYLVDLEGNLTKLTNLSNGDIAFLPVYSKDGNSIMYIYMDFIKQDGKVIGADKKLMLLDLSSFEEVQFMPDNEHRYTLEYFDW